MLRDLPSLGTDAREENENRLHLRFCGENANSLSFIEKNIRNGEILIAPINFAIRAYLKEPAYFRKVCRFYFDIHVVYTIFRFKE